jgi:hypothetical protein
MTYPDFPDFLRIPQAERAAAWKGRKLTTQGSGFKHVVTKVDEAATRQLRKEIAAQDEAKKAARFAALRELRARA